MKDISQRTWSLIGSLYSSRPFWRKLLGRHSSRQRDFEEIADSGETLAAAHLVGFLVNGDLEFRKFAAQSVGQLIRQLQGEDYVAFDDACRREWAYETPSTSGWLRLNPSDLKQFREHPETSATVGLASFHGNGFVREGAVSELAALHGGLELPFLLLRANDWVEAVREAAVAAVLNRVRPEYARQFLEYLPLVLRLRSCARARHDGLVGAITGLLQQPASVPCLKEALSSANREMRREIIKLVGGTAQPEARLILELAMRDQDSIIRLHAFRALYPGLDPEGLRVLLQRLFSDSFRPLRKESLSMFAARFPDEAPAFLEPLLADKNASMRELARYWIRRLIPDVNFPELYRDLLRQDQPRPGAVLGLGETGEKSDARLLLGFMTAPNIGVCKAAIRAMSTLDGERHAEDFLAGLANEHPGVSHEAARALVDRYSLVAMHLPALFAPTVSGHVRRNVFKLLSTQPFWSRGAFFLMAMRDDDARIARAGRRKFTNWLARSGGVVTRPTIAEIQHFREELAHPNVGVSCKERELLEFILKTFA